MGLVAGVSSKLVRRIGANPHIAIALMSARIDVRSSCVDPLAESTALALSMCTLVVRHALSHAHIDDAGSDDL